MPTLLFADLVRELAQEGGTGPLTPTGAVPGHRRFADAVPANTQFHYAVAGIAQPNQWEAGLGRIDGQGRLAREAVAASSNGGAPVDFAPGLKTLALTVGADWFEASDAARIALEAGAVALAGAVDARQPLSTTHAEVATGAVGDLITARRGSGWVNVPLATLPFRDGAGQHAFGGVLSAPAGTADAPSISFTGDLDTGIFRPASNALGFAVGGAERMRFAPDGNVGIGTGSTAPPATRLHVKSSAEIFRLETTTPRGGGLNYISFADPGGRKAYLGYGSGDDRFEIVNEMAGAAHISTGGPSWQFWVAGSLSCVVTASDIRPGGDNNISLGNGASRWSVVYSSSGAINTSDARDKRWRGAATAAELAAARRIIDELGFYQWNEAIAAKGEDGARYHFGVRAQAVWDIMADEGLCGPSSAAPCDQPYAFLCHDAWPDEGSGSGTASPQAETEAAPIREAGSRFGVRPDQLALFLIAAQETRIAALEAAA